MPPGIPGNTFDRGHRQPSALLAWLPDGNSGQSEADAAVPVRRRAPKADRRPAAGAEEEPAATPEHPVRTLREGGIGAPLVHVAMHVVDPQFVGRVRADPRCALQVLSLRSLADGRVAVEVGLL